MDKIKICSECGKAMVGYYYVTKRLCKTCYNKRFEEVNPGYVQNWYLQKLYGISLEQYNEMIVKQLGKCAVCSVQLKRPVVDHCHSSKKVRGLLCFKCNNGLGQFNDDFNLMQKAVNYLKGG